MELKTNYQYTYFIYPFVIKNGKYKEYIEKLLKDKRFKLKIFRKEKDLKIYRYFLPKTRELLFSSFSFTNDQIRDLEEKDVKEQAKILSKNISNIFEYELEKDIQGKVGNSKGIFFTITKVEVICFKTGESFLTFRTSIEGDNNFSNTLNFNYKFRNINQEVSKLNGYDSIRLQPGNFEDVETIKDFIKEITENDIGKEEIDINTERFLTFAYACIDQEAWNAQTDFEKIQNQFIRYANILPADNCRDFKEEKINTVEMWKYAKIGMTKQGIGLFASTTDINNYTLLPEEYQNQYLYTYILNLYKKIYMKRLQNVFKEKKNIKKGIKEFVDFTETIWNQEITEDHIGTEINKKIFQTLELDTLYKSIKNKYDVIYKNNNIEKNKKTNNVITIVLMITMILNIINLMILNLNK